MNRKNIKHSFSELKKPLVWVHYTLGTIGIYAVYTLLGLPFIELEALLGFLTIYIIVDRISHGVLNLR